jgi:RNA polymerase sigma factor for flagellar operon FliA
MTLPQLQQLLGQLSLTGVAALDEMLGDRSDSATLADTIPDSGASPGALLEMSELRGQLADAIERMPEREKVVLTLYYFENLTLAQIGEVLGVTESRVSQIHTKSVLQLRSRLQAARREHV